MREPRPGWWLAVLAAVAVALPTGVSIPLAALVLLLAGGSRWWVRRTAARVETSCTVPAWAHHDQAVEAVVEIRNQSRLPGPWVEIDVPSGQGLGRSRPHREAVMLPPHGKVVRRVPLRCLERGRHHVGPPRIRVGDVLGVASVPGRLTGQTSITVFPRIVPLERLGLPALSPFVTSPSRRSLLVDPTAVVGVRGYEAGDPFSAVHWTATASTGQLMVKQYERAEARETLLCLDLCPQGYVRGAVRASVELAITVAASVLHHSVVVQRLPAGLLTAGWTQQAAGTLVDLPARDDQAHLRRMLEVLALADGGAVTPLSEVLATVRRLPMGTTVLVVTGRIDEGLAANILRLNHHGVPVAVALTGPSAEAGEAFAGEVPAPVYRITDLPGISRLAA